MFRSATHYIRKIAQYGVRQSTTIAARRMHETYREWYWRRAVANGTAHTTWEQFCTQFKLRTNGADFLQQTLAHLQLDSTTIVPAHLATHEIVTLADTLSETLNVLGSGPVPYTNVPWHTDIRARAQGKSDCEFDSTSFYKDIEITCGDVSGVVLSTERDDATLHKDIKVPWELSRAQHLVVIAYAYKLTKDIAYAQMCVHQIRDWIEKNPFMRGVNWVCPMDVGLRAITWIWVLQLLRDELLDGAPENTKILQTIVASLYDHAIYLENNWELYDGRTSNHYLSDLVGYYYVCYLFKSMNRFKVQGIECYKEILREFDKQVFDEGTSYEGSTAYHRLVTELFYHAIIVNRAFGFSPSDNVLKKIDCMLDFLKNCTPTHGRLITRGDHDSGKITYWGPVNNLHQSTKILLCDSINQYKEFGVTVVKKDAMHVLFSEHVYARRQPSGHLHNDALSFTLSYADREIFVDPGSFVYTPSRAWRNYFRSRNAHSTFGIQGHEFVPFDERLFALTMPAATSNLVITEKPSSIELCAYHDLYARFGLRAHRSLSLDIFARTITITDWFTRRSALRREDWWERTKEDLFGKTIPTSWSFVLAPEIEVRIDQEKINLMIDGQPVGYVMSDVPVDMQPGYISREYGSKQETVYLRAELDILSAQRITTVVQLHAYHI